MESEQNVYTKKFVFENVIQVVVYLGNFAEFQEIQNLGQQQCPIQENYEIIHLKKQSRVFSKKLVYENVTQVIINLVDVGKSLESQNQSQVQRPLQGKYDVIQLQQNGELCSVALILSSEKLVVNELYVHKNSIKYLPKLDHLNAEVIDFSQNGLIDVKQFCQGKYPNIKLLNLEQNRITNLPTFIAPHLRILQLDQNQLTEIQGLASGSYPKLRVIKLQSNQLENIPFLETPSLMELNLAYNGIISIEEFSFGVYPNLKILNLKQNSLQNFPQINAPMLKYLNLQTNAITSIRQLAKCFYPQLQHLQLSQNPFMQLPNLPFPQLKHLKAQQNQISDLQQFLQGEYPILKNLTLSINEIKSIKSFKNKFPMLVSLQIDGNQIQSLEQFLGRDKKKTRCELPKLQFLNLANNQIKFLPDLSRFSKLKTLDASSNQLESIDKFANGCYPELTNFDLKWNQLSHLPSLQRIPNLNSLLIQSNQIESLEEFQRGTFQKLEKIEARKNKIQYYPIIKAKKLRNITFTQNELQNIQKYENNDVNMKNSFESKRKDWMLFEMLKQIDDKGDLFSNVRFLQIEKNSITNVEFLQFFNWSSLSILKLRQNNVVIVNGMQKINLPSINYIGLENNPINMRNTSRWHKRCIQNIDECKINGNFITYVNKDAKMSKVKMIKQLLLQNKHSRYWYDPKSMLENHEQLKQIQFKIAQANFDYNAFLNGR